MKQKTLLLGFLSAFLLNIFSAFATWDGLTDAIGQGSFEDAVIQLSFIDWIVYVALLLLLTSLLHQNVFSKFISHSGQSKLFSLLLAFFSVTGFMFVLVKGGIFPRYFVLFAGELLVMAVAIGLFFFFFRGLGASSWSSYFTWLGVLIGLSVMHLYNGLMLDSNGHVKGYVMSSGGSADTLLIQIAQFFYFDSISGIGTYIFIGLAVLGLFLFMTGGSVASGGKNLFSFLAEKNSKDREAIKKGKDMIKRRRELINRLTELYQALDRVRR